MPSTHSLKSRFVFFLSAVAVMFGPMQAGHAAPWLPFGPDGGDARRFATDPHDHMHMYLGTVNGWIYQSNNGGVNWTRLARLAKRDDLVLDSIVVDPANSKHILVGAWVVGRSDGGVFITYDGGVNWINQAEMRGQSVRSMTQSLSDPKVLVAGSLQGVFRSIDGGQHWHLISPPDSTEIHEIQSVAIDPKDPNVIYAGTWHLPWKTTDAGEHWNNIKQGIIEDSDVFSIIVDPVTPETVYASACSGIYKSEDAGLQFTKVKGIPGSARRTRVLLQDPNDLKKVFAGTTEGLFRSSDAGVTWERTTGPEIIVNDVEIDPADSRHVLIATERGGVLSSEDGGDNFHPSNGGFSSRQITALKRDSLHPATVYVGIVNDKEWGGVFESDNGGINWQQRSNGLEGRDVFSLGQAPNGTMIAGTSHGIFLLDQEQKTWSRVEQTQSADASTSNTAGDLPESDQVRPPAMVQSNRFQARSSASRASLAARRPVAAKRLAGSRAVSKSSQPKSRGKLNPRQSSTVLVKAKRSANPQSRQKVAAALPSKDATSPEVQQTALKPTSSLASQPARAFDGSVYALTTTGNTLLAATSSGLLTSTDNGQSWSSAGPGDTESWRYLSASKASVVAASLHGLFYSGDSGATWAPITLPPALTQVAAAAVEPSGEIWVGGREGVFVSSDAGNTWTTPRNLFLNSVNSLYYDEASNRVYVTAGSTTDVAFTVQLPQKSVTYSNTGWNVRFVRPVGDHLVAVTFYDGIVIQPRVMNAPANAETASR